MLLKIKNIGKIREAEIELQGITVIAGNNDTGKSTFGKALYCTFNSFMELNDVMQHDSEDEIKKKIISNNFGKEFAYQFVHVNYLSEESTVKLTIKGNSINVNFNKKRCSSFENNIGLVHNAFYIDSYRTSITHPRESLHRVLLHSKNKESEIQEVVTEKKLNKVWSALNSIVDGNFEQKEYGQLGYRYKDLNESLELVNVSAGMKSFLILKRLLENHAIQEEDVLILDEPEIHLHPEWQIQFAKALVLLQKAFNLTILLTTYSPYFMRAIEVFSIKEKITDCCNYYVTADKDGFCSVENVTEDTDCIYQSLAKPFQSLENILYS
ncbi:MAG: AAA family ATPase [Planctomycetaceae bacterium]|jgi:predicted ATPase|nr:AAA family ATPase [Planctomycetaceae bacterium]